MAHDRAGNGAKSRFAEPVLSPALHFRGDLVPPRSLTRAALDDPVVIEAEREQHRLLQPLVDLPRIRPRRAGELLRHPGLAGIEQPERRLDRVAHLALGLRIDPRAILEGVVDQRLEAGVGHEGSWRTGRYPHPRSGGGGPCEAWWRGRYPHPRSGGATVMIGIARCSAGLKAGALRPRLRRLRP